MNTSHFQAMPTETRPPEIQFKNQFLKSSCNESKVIAGRQGSWCVLSLDRSFANISASCLYTCVTFDQRGVFHICSSETMTGQMLTTVHPVWNPNNQQLHYRTGQLNQRLRKLCLSENCCFILELKDHVAGRGKRRQCKAKDSSVLFCDVENRGADGDGEGKKRHSLVS